MLTRDTHPGQTGTARYGTRVLAIAILRAASRTLDALAARLAPEDSRAASGGLIEFHAEAGAPDGALYIDGHLVGRVTGVQRL